MQENAQALFHTQFMAKDSPYQYPLGFSHCDQKFEDKPCR